MSREGFVLAAEASNWTAREAHPYSPCSMAAMWDWAVAWTATKSAGGICEWPLCHCRGSSHLENWDCNTLPNQQEMLVKPPSQLPFCLLAPFGRQPSSYLWTELDLTRKQPKKWQMWASLVAQWLRIRLPMQGTWVRALVREEPPCRRATKPVCHNYWACALEPTSHNCWAHAPQLLKPKHLEPMLHNKRSHRSEKPVHHREE